MRKVILNVHGIGQPRRALEPGEEKYWVERHFFDAVLKIAEAMQTKVQVSFTFDDGNLSDLDIGAEALARHGRTGTFFVLSDRIGQLGSLAADDIRKLQALGHEIGSHGASHVDWTRLDPAGIHREMEDARDILARITQEKITTAAIPFGRYNATVLKALASRDYKKVYSSDGGRYSSDRSPIPRSSLRADMTETDVQNIILGHEPMRLKLRRQLGRTVKGLL